MTIKLIYILELEESWFLCQLYNTEIQLDQEFWGINSKDPAFLYLTYIKS